MSTDGERDAFGEGASSGERDPVPEFGERTPIGDDADDATIDREFARIVAAWASEAAPADVVGRWPAADDDVPTVVENPPPVAQSSAWPTPAIPDADSAAPPPPPEIWRGPTGSESTPGQDASASAADDDDRYVPPEPPPLGGDFVTRLSWAAVLGGPLFLVLAVLFWRDMPHVLMLAALGAFVGGFIALIARLPRDRGEDDDDGAVV